jgi:hypothetical protein
VDWLLAMTYGAIGGAVVEAVVSSDRVLAWNAARHQALAHTPATPVPTLTAYLDPLSDVAAGVTRIMLGAVAGWLFHSQVTGAYAAIAVGCAAPTVLRQLGSARLTSALGLAIGEQAAEPEHDHDHDHKDEAEQTSKTEHSPTTEPSPQTEPALALEKQLEHPVTAEEHA